MTWTTTIVQMKLWTKHHKVVTLIIIDHFLMIATSTIFLTIYDLGKHLHVQYDNKFGFKM
jgi:hypothetical protein